MTNAGLIDKIKAEIERRKQSLRVGICNPDAFTREQKLEMLVASEELDRLNRFLSTLEGSSEKPNNHLEVLDEAAYTIPLKLLTENKASYGLDSTGMRYPMDCFKAGAEWAFGQGYSQEFTILYTDGVSDESTQSRMTTLTMPVPNDFLDGDKIIVQIRKKN